jgi:hypothetical protein
VQADSCCTGSRSSGVLSPHANRAPRLVVTPLLLTLNVAIYFVMLATGGLSFDTDTMLRWGALAGPLGQLANGGAY